MTFKRFMYAYFGRGWIVLVLVMSIYAIALSLSVFGLSALGAKEDARHHGRKQDFSWKAGFTKRKSQNFASGKSTAAFFTLVIYGNQLSFPPARVLPWCA